MNKPAFSFYRLRLLGCLLAAGTLPLAAQPPQSTEGQGTISPIGASQNPTGAQPAPVQPPGIPPVALKTQSKPAVVRVNVTNQPWDFMRPWAKRAPFSRRAVGAVLADKRVLVTGELVANANFVEFEAPDGGQKVSATVDVVDYEANLALLKAEDPKFMENFEPLEFTEGAVGDTVSVWQLESTGTVLVTKGSLTTAEVARYPIDESALLIYRATVSLQFRDSSFTLPVVKDGKLAGLIMRYDNATKSAEIVPLPVIEHFLKDAARAPYEGFPRAGLAYSNTRDPQFRRYIGLNGDTSGGIYVTELLKGGPAEKAGIQPGDVIAEIDGETIDQDGNYNDPAYGKLSLTHLMGTRHFDGDTVKVTVLRKGKREKMGLTLARRSPGQYVSEPYVIDRAPKFYILGGLVLQELSRQLLKEWGSDWSKKAPEDFVYIDRHQTELFKEGARKIVVLSGMLPSALTVGYEELRQMVVKRINGVELNKLGDVPVALANPVQGLHKIEFEGDPACIYLDAAALADADAMLMQNYRIPVLKRLE
jgi:S1-C subfamily serine protease